MIALVGIVMGVQASFGKKGGDAMDTYQVLTLLFLAGNFLLALLTFVYMINKRK